MSGVENPKRIDGKSKGKVVPPGKHGLYGTYNNYKCRCVPCKEAMRQQRQIWWEPGGLSREGYEKRRRIINAIKITASCIDCGYDKDPIALDFDHLRDKKFQISSNVTRSLKSIFLEIMKCEVRCANCHRKVTKLRRRGIVPVSSGLKRRKRKVSTSSVSADAVGFQPTLGGFDSHLVH